MSCSTSYIFLYLYIWRKIIHICSFNSMCVHGKSICICICVFGECILECMSGSTSYIFPYSYIWRKIIYICGFISICVFERSILYLYLCIWKMYSGVHVAFNFLHHLLSCLALAFHCFPCHAAHQVHTKHCIAHCA